MKDSNLPLPPKPPRRVPPRPRPRSYEEDMTPPRGMRDFRPEMTPGGVESFEEDMTPPAGMRTKRMKSGGKVRGDGCAIKGKTKGRIV